MTASQTTHIFPEGKVIFINLGKHRISTRSDGKSTFRELVEAKVSSDPVLHCGYCKKEKNDSFPQIDQILAQMDYDVETATASFEFHH